MKDIVHDRLSRMEDLEQRKLLKQLMTGLFLNLVEYQEEMNRNIERKVFDEVEDGEDKHDIFVSMCRRDDLDPIHDFLHPMLPEDAARKPIDMSSLVEQVQRQEEALLFTLFLQCDFAALRELLTGKRTFRGEMKTSGGSCAIQVRLLQSRLYINEIEKLYHVFQQNSIPWKTVNHPYAHKFFDVLLTDCEDTLREEDEIYEITVDLEEFEPHKRVDVVPLWNIEQLAIKNSGFPVPASDRVNFEHVLSLHKTGSEHGYLVEGNEDNIRYIKRTRDELTIVSPQEKAGIWNVLKISQPVASRLGSLEYELVSNRRTDGFIGKYARRQAQIVRAKGEILRIVHSFDAARMLQLEHVDIRDRVDGTEQTYEMNPFISDNVRTERDKKVMRLGFRARNADKADNANNAEEGNRFILHDLMSFLVSEVQMYFPEYKCEGEWA
ncbi:normocyte-binding protein [Paenibacillus apiarius]|uniref:Normocyte-binding protein n=1 Tax=Paenibacillus apiarius TaxID=46240 RepID=A0ABT4DTG5_9BACL|nr:normocyte-binding protein [Paenibacillus apiarius]MCY9513886.1 normocyte-binding protein [Paenibacillus apiarius]MCY9519403.1 normocyte-binding protein [Paenibacillus apiarius]MCY9552370.1 normocyte-binding protein [Paenibacillus apiarius]MCY9556158.1 normocyte-binding protein [Paenibacillus apiarius]MCY9681693.1 normocyte-binding protein [Paenibacillus apiarius]